MLTLLKSECSLGLTIRITSPAARPGSEQPASPRSVILEPAFIP